MRKSKGFTLIELMIVIAIIAIIAAIAIPGLLQSQRASNERNASASLKTLATAEADFRANDRDANKVQDFWTGDVSQLYAMIPQYVSGNAPDNIKLIEISVAAADAVPYAGATTGAVGGGTAGASVAMNTLTQTGPKSGYWYEVLLTYTDTAGNAGVLYAQDTENVGPAVHNNSRFGFITYPDAVNASGNTIFIINEGNTIFKAQAPAGIEVRNAGVLPGAGLNNTFTTAYPDDAALLATWAKMD